MKWSLSDTLALAPQDCVHCHGLGMVSTRGKGAERACHCALRAIFRACYAKFRVCAARDPRLARVVIDGRRSRYSFANQEYCADFLLIAYRELGRDTLAGRLFRYHYLLGADWRLCGRKLSLERGEFFHEVYRVQQRLGRVFRETEPYPLYPLDEYFGGRVRAARALTTAERGRNPEPLRAPLKTKIAA